MKFVIRIVFVATLLLALVGVSSATAHAATSTTTAVASPNITIVNCTDSNFFDIHSTSSGDWCFANAGYVPITIPDVSFACSGNNEADIYTTSGTFFAAKGVCAGFGSYVTVIGLNIH